MKPLGNRVIVKEIPVDKIGSLFIPEVGKAGQTAPIQGHVVSVGSKVEDVKEGDRVVFCRYAPMEVMGDKLIMPETDILAVLEE